MVTTYIRPLAVRKDGRKSSSCCAKFLVDRAIPFFTILTILLIPLKTNTLTRHLNMQYTTTLALALAVASTAAFPAKRQAAAACAPVHLIVARASGEDPGEGIIGAVSQDIQARVPGADAEAVEYPAALVPYQASEAEGVAEMTRLVTEYAAACPDSKMVLMGYSQGGQVALDTLCGTSSVGFEVTEPVAGDVAEKGESCRTRRMGDGWLTMDSCCCGGHGRTDVHRRRAIHGWKRHQRRGKCTSSMTLLCLF